MPISRALASLVSLNLFAHFQDPNQTAAIVVTVAILSCMALFTGVVLTVTYFGQPVPEEVWMREFFDCIQFGTSFSVSVSVFVL